MAAVCAPTRTYGVGGGELSAASACMRHGTPESEWPPRERSRQDAGIEQRQKAEYEASVTEAEAKMAPARGRQASHQAPAKETNRQSQPHAPKRGRDSQASRKGGKSEGRQFREWTISRQPKWRGRERENEDKELARAARVHARRARWYDGKARSTLEAGRLLGLPTSIGIEQAPGYAQQPSTRVST